MRGQFYSMWLPAAFKDRGRIVINEMINILLAIRAWGDVTLRDSRVVTWCDNSAVVEVMNRNKTRDVGLVSILRDILMTQAKYNIQLEVRHVMGEQNPIADALSRVHQDKCYQCMRHLDTEGYVQTVIKDEYLWLTDELM